MQSKKRLAKMTMVRLFYATDNRDIIHNIKDFIKAQIMRKKILPTCIILVTLLSACRPAASATPVDAASAAQAGVGVSGAYLRISNNGDSDITLLSAQAAGVGMIQIHETLVENDIAQMRAVEAGLVIPVGETVSLRPGGLHLMLMNLETDLHDGETLNLILNFDNGAALTITAPVQRVEPDSVEAVTAGSITVEDAWVRPTALRSTETTD